MTPSNQIDGIEGNVTEIQGQPDTLPIIAPKPGWTTSQGQMTAIFAVVSMILAYFGFSYSPEQIGNVYELIMQIVTVVVPLVTGAATIINYTNSRGKTCSNAINSSAAISTAANLGGLGSLLGGKNWKDPARYKSILDIVGKTGIVPGPAGKVIDVITDDGDEQFEAEVSSVLGNHEARLRALENK